MAPIEMPVGGLILIGLVVFSFSRLFLTMSKDGAILAAAILGILIFGAAIALSFAPQMKRTLVVGALVLGAVLVLALGIFGAVRGEREFEVDHEASVNAVVVPHVRVGVDF